MVGVMARRQANRARVRGFIPLPKEGTVTSDIKIDGTSVKTDVLSAVFERSSSQDIGFFKINLINSDGAYSNKYTGGETVQFFTDRASGTTKRFEGKIDHVKNKQGAFETLEVSGGHLSSELLDLTVTREYDGNTTCDTILKEIIDAYLTGYTTTNVGTSTVTPNLKWSNKSFWSCVEDLCRLAISTVDITDIKRRFDCYVDDDKDFHFFEENSIENNDEPIWRDSLIRLEGFGEQSTLTKNKIIVYGDDGTGLPIIRNSIDSASQIAFGLKEEVITDTDILTGDQAVDLANASLNLNKTPEKEGKATCFIMEGIALGEKVWIINPTMKLTQQIKVSTYRHLYPLEQTEVILTKKRDVANLFRDRMVKDLENETIINPYEMTDSINLTFDNFNDLGAYDDNIAISEGKLILSSGTTGTVTTRIFRQLSNITQVQLKIVGGNLPGTVYKVSTDGGQTLETITPDSLFDVTPGINVLIKIFINSATTEIDSLALLMK